MNKSSSLIRTITEVALFAALGFVFDELQSILTKSVFIAGGSIGFAMIAVIIVSFRRGPIAGFATGLIMGLLDIATGPYIVNFWQLLLDYIFPYCFVTVCSIFIPLFNKLNKKSLKALVLTLSVIVGGVAKFISHYLSGVIFFANAADFLWNLQDSPAWIYSLIYNIAYMGPCIVLTSIIVVALFLSVPQIFMYQNEKKEAVSTERYAGFDYVLNPSAIAFGIFLFVFYLIKYINSYEGYVDDSYYQGVAYGADFDRDSLLLFVTGFLIIYFATSNLVASFIKKQNYRLITISYFVISFSNVIYAIARLIKNYKKEVKPLDTLEHYWKWFAISLVLAAIFISIFLIFNQKDKESKKN